MNKMKFLLNKGLTMKNNEIYEYLFQELTNDKNGKLDIDTQKKERKQQKDILSLKFDTNFFRHKEANLLSQQRYMKINNRPTDMGQIEENSKKEKEKKRIAVGIQKLNNKKKMYMESEIRKVDEKLLTSYSKSRTERQKQLYLGKKNSKELSTPDKIEDKKMVNNT